MSSLSSAGATLSPLEKFISDFFKAVVIQDDEKVFQETMHREVSKHVKERCVQIALVAFMRSITSCSLLDLLPATTANLSILLSSLNSSRTSVQV